MLRRNLLRFAIPWLAGIGGSVEVLAQSVSPDGRGPGVAAVTSASVPANVQRWGITDGLPQSSVTALLVDEDGFLWGSTFGGLFRFDGRQFRTFQPDRNIGENSLAITSMARSQKGGFWVVSAYGAVSRVVRGAVEEALPVPEGLPAGEYPVIVHETRDGRIWINGWGRAYLWDGVRWAQQPGSAPRVWPAHGIVEAPSGETIMGTVLGYRNLSGDDRLPAPFDAILVDSIASIPFEDALGRIWIGSRANLDLYAEGETIPIPEVTGLLLGAFPRYDGSVWLVTYAGIWLVRGPGLDQPGTLATASFDVRPVLPRPIPPRGEILSAALTGDDVLMIGTLGLGLVAVTPQSVYRLDIRPYLRDVRPDTLANPTHSVAADRNGGLWVSRECGRVVRLQGSILESLQNSIADLEATDEVRDCIRSLFVTRDGSLIAGLPNGFLRVRRDRPQIDTVFIPGPSVPDAVTPLLKPAPRAFLELGDTLLIGMSNGWLLMLEGDGSAGVRGFPGWRPQQDSFSRLALGSNGTIWTGLVSRLRAIQADGRVTEHRDEDSAGQHAEIRALIAEEDGGLWIGRYGGGLSYRSPSGIFRRIPLQDPTISGMVALDDGSLWLAQNSGITILLPGLVDAARRGEPLPPMIRRITLADGAAEVNNGRPAMAVLSSGLVAVSTVEGLLLADPRTLPPPSPSRPVRLDAIRTASGDLDPRALTVRLPSGERALEVDLVIPIFRSTDPVRVRYRLVSGNIRRLASEWVELPYGDALRLGGLAPGRKRLYVETALAGGGWVSSPPLEIQVQPFFLERASVQLGIFLLIAGLLVALARGWSREAEQQRNVEIQRRVEEERERHLSELALMGRHAVAGELTASLAHEMGQPLSAMLHTASAVKREMETAPLTPEVLDETLDEFVGQIHRARNVLHGMRRFLRSETPRVERMDPAQVIRETQDLLRREIQRQRASVALDLPAEPLWILAERVLIQQILIILFSNALDAMERIPVGRRRVRVRARAAGDGVRITVQDEGQGIEAALLPRIFEPFETRKQNGMGMGLAIARRIVRSHGGEIRIRSRVGAGTTVSFWLPRVTHSGDQPKV